MGYGDRQIPEFEIQVPGSNDSPWNVLIQNLSLRMPKGADDPKFGFRIDQYSVLVHRDSTQAGPPARARGPPDAAGPRAERPACSRGRVAWKRARQTHRLRHGEGTTRGARPGKVEAAAC